jgi:HK97 family phage portal protein
MGWLANLGTIAAARPADDDDRWYEPRGMMTAAGVPMSPEGAMGIAAAYACVRVVSNAFASLPAHIYRKAGDRKDIAADHYLYDLIHTQPNPWQTAFEWKRMGAIHILNRGAFYNRIVAGPRGFCDSLVPLLGRVTPERLETGRIRYRHARPAGGEEKLLQDEVFVVRGWTPDGINTLGVVDLAIQTLGNAAAANNMAGRFWKNNATPGGIIKSPKVIDSPAATRIRENWQKGQTGENYGKTAILDEGMEYVPVSLSLEAMQFLESRAFEVTEIARWYGVPPHKIADLSRATFSNIEHQAIEFVQDAIVPMAINWEQAIQRDLILEPDCFAKFSLGGLLRGDSQSRAQFYKDMVLTGIFSRNECRDLEDMNPAENLGEFLEPQNMAPAGTQQPRLPAAEQEEP